MAAEGPDSVEQQSIRGLDIDKTVKGFALIDYTFKNECTVSTTSADSIRWYQETSTDLTATSPQQVANISPLSTFPTLEPTWTRQTSYMRKYAAEGFISMEDIKSADIDVIARTLLRLTRAVTKQVDTRIYAVITEGVTAGVSPTNVQIADIAQYWDTSSGSVVADLAGAKKLIYDYGYNPEGASLILHPTEYKLLIQWLIDYKGSSIPGFSSEKVRTGTVMNLMGLNVKVSPNATTDYAVVSVPQQGCSWKTYSGITSRAIDEPGIGTRLRVWEMGEAILTDPKCVVILSGSTT